MITAKYVDHMGSDKRVVDAARVSFNVFNSQSELTTGDIGLIKFLARGCPKEDWDEFVDLILNNQYLEHVAETHLFKEDVLNQIKYIRKMAIHWVPFAHCQITMIEEVPLSIFAQREKHDVGFIGGKSMVESSVSRRYKTEEIKIYSPAKWRKKPEGNIKQGSGGDFDESTSFKIQKLHNENVDTALETYYAMLDAGVAPEQARFELPTGTMTKYMVTGSLYAYANAYIQRSDSHAQTEIQKLAEHWDRIIRPLYPSSWAALVDGNYD